MTDAIIRELYKRLIPRVRYAGHQIKSLIAKVYIDLIHYDDFKTKRITVKEAINEGLIKAAVCKGLKYYTKNRRYKMDEIKNDEQPQKLVTVENLNKSTLLDMYLTVINEYRGGNNKQVSTGEYMKAIECTAALLNRKIKDYEPPVSEDTLEDTLNMLRNGKFDV